MAFLWHGKARGSCSRCRLCAGTWRRARAGHALRPESRASPTLDTEGWGWGIALVPVLGDEQRCGNKSFSNYIFMGTSTFSHFLGLASWSLIRVKFKVHSPPVEVLPVRNKFLLVHSSLFFQRIKPQQIRAIFLLNDGTHVGSSARFGARSLTLTPRFDSFPQDQRV